MLKKLVSLLIIVSILMAFGMTVYAAPTEGTVRETVSTERTPAETRPSESFPAATESRDGKHTAPQISFEEMFNSVVQNAGDTDQFLVTITRPDKDKDCAYEKSYVISGIASSNLRICMFRKNADGKYAELSDTDGSSSWDVSEGSIFSKEIILEKGANSIKIVAYKTGDTSSLKKEDIQVNKFTVSYIETSIKTVIMELGKGISEFITGKGK